MGRGLKLKKKLCDTHMYTHAHIQHTHTLTHSHTRTHTVHAAGCSAGYTQKDDAQLCTGKAY